MKPKIILMHGLPSSGKSTLAKRIQEENDCAKEYAICIFSTDDYWLRPDGRYDWNFKLLNEAHEWNQKRVENYVSSQNGIPNCAIVDNTNLQSRELVPYLNIAKKYNCDVDIVEPETPWRYDVDELVKRNTYNVPRETIEKMLARKVPIEQLREYINEFMVKDDTANSINNGV